MKLGRGLPALDHRTVDAAWSPKFGVVSAGTPETAATAARKTVGRGGEGAERQQSTPGGRARQLRARWVARLPRHVSSLPSCSSREEWIPARSINILAFIDGHQQKLTRSSRRACWGSQR